MLPRADTKSNFWHPRGDTIPHFDSPRVGPGADKMFEKCDLKMSGQPRHQRHWDFSWDFSWTTSRRIPCLLQEESEQ